jgi:phosphatidylserine/phosphatidylglycerophosphate/cardiolipin synthase-like enzyme
LNTWQLSFADGAAEVVRSPLSREGTVRGDLSLVIRSAREEVVVASPYFVPGEEAWKRYVRYAREA